MEIGRKHCFRSRGTAVLIGNCEAEAALRVGSSEGRVGGGVGARVGLDPVTFQH